MKQTQAVAKTERAIDVLFSPGSKRTRQRKGEAPAPGAKPHAARIRGKNYPWDKERVDLACALYKEGKYASDIVKTLAEQWPKDGKPTRNAVIGKISRTIGDGIRENKGNNTFIVRKPSAHERPRLPHYSTSTVKSPPTPVNLKALEPSSVTNIEDHMTLEEIRSMGPMRMEDGSAATIATLKPRMCHYPIGDPKQSGFAYCGRGQRYVGNEPTRYCAAHSRLMYDPQEAKRRDRELQQISQKLPRNLRS